MSADRGVGKVLSSAPGVSLGADRAPCASGSAWATHDSGLPDFLFQDPAVHYVSIITAPVIRSPVKDEYPGWFS